MTSGTSWREELVRRLETLGPPPGEIAPLRETCFVLLWSYFEEEGLVRAENRLAQHKVHPLRIRPLELPTGSLEDWLQESREKLTSLNGNEFDQFALEWLAVADQLLEERRKRPNLEAIRGLDGRKLFQVHQRREYLAEKLEKAGRRAAAWVGYQGDAIEAYARFHKAIRVDAVQGYQIVTTELGRREHRNLRARLNSDWEKGHFRVMLWPLETQLEYLGLKALDLSKGAEGSQEKVNFVHLRQVENEAALLAEIPRMLEAANTAEVTLLILPELAIPQAVEDEIRQLLAGRKGQDYPLLTLFGRCHRQVPEQDIDVNEAILLGPDGTEILCHRKLVPFTGPNEEEEEEEPIYLAEQIERGTHLTVLECPFGNLSVVICIDLFRMKRLLEDSHATLVAVPSLSPKTSAHRSAAVDLMVKNKACTFVTNRWIKPPAVKAATSFYQLPVKDGGYKAHIDSDAPFPSRLPYLLFTL